jgi:hypothetical protein
VGVICLATGAVIDAAIGPHAGKGSSELGLLRTLDAALSPGDVMLADAFYCNYFWLRSCSRRVSTCCLNRTVRAIPAFGAASRWAVSAEQYAEFPDELTVREVLVDGQILVTTLPNPRKVRKGALGQLYAQRWNVELGLRNIKTTLGVEVLRCLTRGWSRRSCGFICLPTT